MSKCAWVVSSGQGDLFRAAAVVLLGERMKTTQTKKSVRILNIMASSLNSRCHRNGTIRSLCILTYRHVAGQQYKTVQHWHCATWVPFALLSSYRMFRTALNNINVIRSSCKVPDIFCLILTKFWVSVEIFLKLPSIKKEAYMRFLASYANALEDISRYVEGCTLLKDVRFRFHF